MKKQQTEPAIDIEWNYDPATVRSSDFDGLCKDDLLALARALGRMAARRDLALAREDRARSVITSDVMPGTMRAK